MTFQQLQYLIEVHKAGSFSQAAKNLYITQSAISNAIIGLEKEIGSPLFIRSQYGLAPTPRGEEVIRHAEQICSSMQQITSKKATHKKAVRVGCGNFTPVADAYVRFLKENLGRTDIEFSIQDTRTEGFIKALLNYEIDIAFYFKLTSYSQGTQKSIEDEGLCYEELVTLPAAVSFSPKHPLYNKETVEIKDLRPYPLLDSSKNGVSNARILCAYLPVSKDNLVIARGYTNRQRILEEGLAYKLSHLPPLNKRNDNFRYIPVDGLSYTFYSVTNPKYPRSTELKRFIELVKEEIAAGQY